MIQQQHKRQLLSILMVLLFVFSITPQRTIHDIFKCHKGYAEQPVPDGKATITKGSFHCSCQQADLQVAFIHSVQQPITIPQVYNFVALEAYSTTFYASISLAHAQRGPPAIT